MSKKNSDFYFDNFDESVAVACEAARMMKDILVNFDAATLSDKKEELHGIEHRGDLKKHEMTEALLRAFITPIERDDILHLSQNIDNVTDAVEDIIIHIYINGITEIRFDAIAFADVIIQCCEAMQKMIAEFRNFKKSKIIEELLIEINRLEEVGDGMYMETSRRLHMEEKDPLTVMVWREIYEYFEKCCDACEDVADIVEGITIGNT